MYLREITVYIFFSFNRICMRALKISKTEALVENIVVYSALLLQYILINSTNSLAPTKS